MPTTIRTREPRELLALVPYQLGFHPAESAVVVSLRGPRSTVGTIARMDLADLADPVHGADAARALMGHLLADGARRVVVVLYTAEVAPGGRGVRGTARAGADEVLRAAEQAFGATECWVVGPHGWWALGCSDAACCPPGGRPLAELESTRVGAEMVLRGVQVAPSRERLVTLPVVDAAARKAARRARDRWAARRVAATTAAEAHRWRREGVRLWREALTARLEGASGAGGSPAVFGEEAPLPPPTVVGRLLAGLEDVLVRDAVLLSFVAGTERVADRLVAGEAGADVGHALGAITDPRLGRRPDPARSGAARAVLEHVVGHAPRGGHAPGLTLLAVLAWWEGDGARAGVLVDRALAVDPGHRLAVLVDQALRAGMPPGWARAC
jgi:hypothetical protein